MDVSAVRKAKDDLYDAWASVAKALGSGRRAEIVELLAHGERSVEEVAIEIDQSVANTSHHLRALAAVGLVRSRREGQRVIYGLASLSVAELWTEVREVAATHLAGIDVLVDQLRSQGDQVGQVTAEDLADRVRRRRAVVVDVRPSVEYTAGHILGARSIPLEMLEASLDALPRSREILVYCRGQYCVYADEAVLLLKARGFKARRLDTGFLEWVRDDRPVGTVSPD